jgi:predicted ferric reductase
MTAIAEQSVNRTRTRPGAIARTALLALAAANVVVVNMLLFSTAEGNEPMVLIGRFFGLHAALIMIFQLILVARLPWLDRRIGMDKLTSWHRITGFTLITAVVAHVVFIIGGFSASSGLNPIDQLTTFMDKLEGVVAALIAVILLLVVGFTSAKFARRKLPYEVWHLLHLATYVAILLPLTHQVILGPSFMKSPAATTYWYSLYAVGFAALISGRILLPLWRNFRHKLVVTAVVRESENVASIYMTGRHLDKMPASAGQFFLWRFMTPKLWWQAHPFSLSAAPDGRGLRLTVKAVGKGSAALHYLRPGVRVFAEGPYGAFTSMHRTKPMTLLIAGGVGITPVRALLEELTGHTVVLYRARTQNDAVLARELHQIAAAKGAFVRMLIGPSAQGGPVFGPAALMSMVPDIRDRDIYVCGPPKMTDAVLEGLRALDIPTAQIHAERFSMAS